MTSRPTTPPPKPAADCSLLQLIGEERWGDISSRYPDTLEGIIDLIEEAVMEHEAILQECPSFSDAWKHFLILHLVEDRVITPVELDVIGVRFPWIAMLKEETRQIANGGLDQEVVLLPPMFGTSY